MSIEDSPEVVTINQQAIRDALNELKNRTRLADPMAELNEEERLCGIILGERAHEIQLGLNYRSDEVASIVSEVVSKSPTGIKLATLRRIVEFLDSDHPLREKAIDQRATEQ